ncbi:zinc finger protein 626 [Gouania willdenowi]|uniref:zinc finger protein 626 n=1 Tax=Gouania willdenowi TaxID=441366 RepID=UPI00105596FA|nr:zinc finger protein 626-like [Gouania willdenowi]XP_028309726.1 zinc finger protein 626-like [Gouania willdenowi]XP_028309727.1 zinc finger protein 626-like [Gouania willdenowi]
MCQFCSETFCTEASLRYHKMRNHSKDATHKSRTAQMKKGSRTTRYSNKILKTKKKILKCRSCEMVFMTTSSLHVHRKDKHSREKIVTKPKLVVAKTRRVFSYPCELCSKVFVHHLSLRAHYRHQHTAGNAVTDQPPSDQHVAKVFKLSEIRVCLSDITRVPAEASARRIDSMVEDTPEDPESSEEEEAQEVDPEFPCPSCPEVFPLQWQLKEHMELHQSSARSGQCSVCTQHMDSCKWPGSKRQRLYHCVPCQQGFSALDSFLQHCQEHLRVRVEEDGIAEGLHKPDGSL